MGVIDVLALSVGIVGILFGLRCYRELWKWARQCQNARIAIAYKKRVVLQAPLIEWLLWTNMLENDKASHGRVVFSRAGVSVAIAKAAKPPGKIRQAIRSVRAAKGQAAPTVREGTWASQDETPEANKVKA